MPPFLFLITSITRQPGSFAASSSRQPEMAGDTSITTSRYLQTSTYDIWCFRYPHPRIFGRCSFEVNLKSEFYTNTEYDITFL